MTWMNYERFMRDLKPALPLFNNVCNWIELPERLRKNALNLYKQLIIKGLTKGRVRNALISACIYLTSNEMNYPIKTNELLKASETGKTGMIRAMKFIKKYVKTEGASVNPEEYISLYCYELGINEKAKTEIFHKLKNIQERLINKPSQTIAAVTIHLTSKNSIRKLERITGVSKTALTNSLKILKDRDC